MDTTFFAENQLPKNQKPIQTSNVTRAHMFLSLLTDEERTSPTMGVLTGVAGIGKTIAIQLYHNQLMRSPYTALPIAINVTVDPRSSPRDLASAVLESLREKPRGKRSTSNGMANDAARAIERYALRLLTFDEADHLSADNFDLIRHLFDKTGCPIALVGLASICDVIDRYEKFWSRVGLRLPFLPLEETEILTVVLPQLTIARWVYQADNPEDQQMGKDLWQRVTPSLRNLVGVINTASQIAKTYDCPTITATILQEAFFWAGFPPEAPHTPRESPGQSQEAPGTHEQQSEERHEGKQRRRTSRKPAA